MTDRGGTLIARLREAEWSGKRDGRPCDRGTTCWPRNPDGEEAAAEIDRLTDRVKWLEEALKPFASMGELIELETEGFADDDVLNLIIPSGHLFDRFAVGDFRRARAAFHALQPAAPKRAFKRGDRVEKVSGSSWRGVIVGEYSTSLTPEGYAVESEREPGSVQIYPAKALGPPRRG